MPAWFERDPERLEQELKALEDRGVAYEIDEAARIDGRIRITLKYPYKDRRIELTATYPDLFPYFKPEVDAPELRLARHQSLLGTTLCLLGRRTHNWHVTDTLAGILSGNLGHLVDFEETGDIEAIRRVEEPQGEPVSDYYNSAATEGSYLLFETAWRVDPAVERGVLNVKCRWVSSGDPAKPDVFQGYIENVSDETGKALCSWSGPVLPGKFQSARIRWVRANRRHFFGPNELLETTGDHRSWLISPLQKSTGMKQVCCAVLVEEEITQGQYGDGWLALQLNQSKARKGFRPPVTPSIIQTFRAGPDDLFSRMPGSSELRTKTVAVFGLGAIGAPTALELARHGVGRLQLIDHDIVDPATVRRWPIGLPAFGCSKPEVLAERIMSEYPWTDVDVNKMKVGGLPDPDQPPGNQRDHIWNILKDCDLLLDCTAELGVNHFLSDMAQASAKPYVLANATPGAAGGMVAVFTEGEPCWICMREGFYGATPSLALPPEDEAGTSQPPGCAEPTFTGRSCDLLEISLQAVRSCLSVLVGGNTVNRSNEQVLTLGLVSDTGAPVPPTWKTQAVIGRKECSCISR